MELPNNCKCGLISVTPANWEESNASVKHPWCISYRFHNHDGKIKQVKIRRMNYDRKLRARQKTTRQLIEDEKGLLKAGYNPVIGPSSLNRQDYIIDPRLGVMTALEMALERIQVEDKMRRELKSMLKHVAKAAKACGINLLQVADIRKRHIKMILETIGKANKKWSANYFNHYLKYLSILFRELSGVEAIEFNPCREIPKLKTVRKVRQILTPTERTKINDHLKANYPRFWLFMQCFFSSGARETELLKVRAKDVNLVEQTVKVTIIKGNQRKEASKTIVDNAVEYWEEALQGCYHNEYVFAKGLKPGTVPINSIQITRRWRQHVKQKLGIDKDFYGLKHLFSDQTAAILSLDEARKHNSHTSEKTTRLYAVNEKEREHERLKKIDNKFA